MLSYHGHPSCGNTLKDPAFIAITALAERTGVLYIRRLNTTFSGKLERSIHLGGRGGSFLHVYAIHTNRFYKELKVGAHPSVLQARAQNAAAQLPVRSANRYAPPLPPSVSRGAYRAVGRYGALQLGELRTGPVLVCLYGGTPAS